MGWKIIEIENAEYLNLFLDNLVIKNKDTKITIQLNDIDVLLINNYKLSLTVQLINALTSKNILTIICNNKCLPESLIVPIIGNFNTIKIIESQIKWDYLYKSKTWKAIISQKIQLQRSLLEYLSNDFETVNMLNNLLLELKDYDISNREGHASKIYWHSLFGKTFKRHEDDYANLLLNYGYTILRAYLTRSIIKKGLDPRISIFHKSFQNYFALSSDLMEPFRILIDYKVYQILKNEPRDFHKHKSDLINLFNSKIIVNNKLQFINNAIDIFVDAIVANTELPEIKIDYDIII